MVKNTTKTNKIMERLIKIDKMDDDFDLKFWKMAGDKAKIEATWNMVVDYLKIRGVNGKKIRLRRDIQNIKQR